MSAARIRIYLGALHLERRHAEASGLTACDLYRADLESEIEAVTHAYTVAAVTEIATLRAELSGPQMG